MRPTYAQKVGDNKKLKEKTKRSMQKCYSLYYFYSLTVYSFFFMDKYNTWIMYKLLGGGVK